MTDFSFLDCVEYNQFISQYANTDPNVLRLKKFPTLPFPIDFAIRQIECRKKATRKIPELASVIIYPTNVSIEQASSEIVAKFHGSLFKSCNQTADLTSGLGIDSYYISKEVSRHYAVEIDKTVSEVVFHNYKSLSCDNINVLNMSAEEFIQTDMASTVQAYFVDPSRRDTNDRFTRVVAIEDCQPNLMEIIPQIQKTAKFILVKLSPMLDVTALLQKFHTITNLWVVSVKNECKEILLKIDFTTPVSKITPLITALNFELSTVQIYSIGYEDVRPVGRILRTPIQDGILIVPNASVMKIGTFGNLCEDFGIWQIATNSHLFWSDIISDKLMEFPGKLYRINKVLPYSRQGIRELKDMVTTANLACRNFPLSATALRKQLKIKDGGDAYLFATTTYENKKILLVTEKLG